MPGSFDEAAYASIEFDVVADGLQFPEGPIALDDGSVLIVEIARGTLTQVAPDGSTEVVADCGGGPNGAAIGPDGAIYVCNNGGFEWTGGSRGRWIPGNQAADYTGGSIQRVDPSTGAVATLYTEVDGHRLGGPNDLVFDGSGGFWFTDHGKTRPRDRDRGGVYYARTDGSSISEVLYPLDAPNGIGLSPAEDLLIVAETHQGRVHTWVLDGPGTIAGYFGPGHRGTFLAGPSSPVLFDSLAVDADGNTCVATIVDGGITVISPDGETLHVPTGDPMTTNICFGGPGLTTAWVTGSYAGTLLRATWPTAGHPLAYRA